MPVGESTACLSSRILNLIVSQGQVVILLLAEAIWFPSQYILLRC